jgi:hypothetical protein
MHLAKTLVLGLAVGLVFTLAAQQAKADSPKTITGKSSCGGCAGVVKGCCVMLTDADGMRWILRGDSKVLKTAFDARHKGKSMTATLVGAPTDKKDDDGKDYKEVKVSDVKIDAT